MEYAEFRRSLNKEVMPVYLFEGEEVYLFETGLKAITDLCVTSPEINAVTLQGDGLTPEALLPLVSALPFLSQKRVVAVRDYYPKSSVLSGALSPLMRGDFSDTVFVIMNQKSCDALKKIKTVTVVSCGRQDAATLSKWAIKRAESAGKKLSVTAANLLVTYTLLDMIKIANEVDKLICYVGDADEITEADIENAVTKDSEYKIYELTDSIGKKNYEKALKILNDMIYGGEQPQKLLSNVYFYMRRLFDVAISDKPDSELSKIFGVKEFAIKKAREQAKMFKLKKLKKTVDALADYDYMAKSGGLDFGSALNLAIFNLTTD